MRWIVAMVLALGLASSAAAETTDVEQIKLRPERYVDRAVSIDGTILMAMRDFTQFQFAAGKLGTGNFTLRFVDRGAAWEFAQYECAGDDPLPKCKAHVIGVLKKDPVFADTYFIQGQQIDFLAAE